MKLTIIVLAAFISCSIIIQNKVSQYQKIGLASLKDTVIHYDIEGVSLEGVGVEAHYTNDILRWALIGIYGETFQIQIKYYFGKEHINAVEKQYEYRTEMFYDVKSKDDIILIDSFDYSLNYITGDLYRIDSGHKHTPIFKEFNKAVPYNLKD